MADLKVSPVLSVFCVHGSAWKTTSLLGVLCSTFLHHASAFVPWSLPFPSGSASAPGQQSSTEFPRKCHQGQGPPAVSVQGQAAPVGPWVVWRAAPREDGRPPVLLVRGMRKPRVHGHHLLVARAQNSSSQRIHHRSTGVLSSQVLTLSPRFHRLRAERKHKPAFDCTGTDSSHF